LELLMREHQERDERPQDVKRAVAEIQATAGGGRADELRRLLEAHPDLLDARGVDRAGQTALHRAAWNDRIECVRVLLDAGADVSIRDYADHAAAVRGFVERDRGLLGARMSRSEHRRTPLHHAATLDRADMVRLLIDLGADVAATDDTGATPLTAAALRAGAPAIVAMLERAGAKLDLLGAV